MRLIDAFYDAAQDPQRWPMALKAASEAFGAAGATLLVIDRPTGGLRLFEGHNIPDHGLAEYRAHYMAIDPRLRFVRQQPQHRVYFDHLHHSEQEIERDEYYAWLRDLAGFRYYAAMRTIDTGETAGFFTIQRAAGQGHVEQREVDLLQFLQRHIVRSSEISVTLGSTGLQLEATREALHEVATSVILLDRRGRMIFKNDAAEALLLRSQVLRCEGEATLGARAPGDRYRLQRAIADALRGIQREAESGGDEINLSGEDERPVTVRVMPLFGRDRPILGSDAAVAIFVHDPDQHPVDCLAGLSSRFNFTRAEALLCQALIEGRSLQEHAAQAGINRETVRSHLKRALIKTGTRRQAELVAYLMRRMPPLR